MAGTLRTTYFPPKINGVEVELLSVRNFRLVTHTFVLRNRATLALN